MFHLRFVAAGFCYHYSLYFLVLKCTRVCEALKTRLDEYEKRSFSKRFVEMVRGILATIVGIHAMHSCSVDLLHDQDPFVDSFISFGITFFVYDVQAMYWTHRAKLGAGIVGFVEKMWPYLVHHGVIAFIIGPFVITYRRDMGDYFFGCFMISDLSIVLLCICLLMKQAHLDDVYNRLYVGCGILLAVVFLLCRVLIFPFMYWRYAKWRDYSTILEGMREIPWFCNGSCLLIFLPQVYWFLVIAGKLVQRAVRYANSDESSVELNNTKVRPQIEAERQQEKKTR